MKKLVFLLSALSLMACNKNEDDEKVVAEKEVSIPAGAFYKSVAVEVPEGQKAEVYVGGMKTSEICGPTSTEVLVPANAMAVDGLRSVSLDSLEYYSIKYVPFSGEGGDVHTMMTTIAFEDLRDNIDADYNDFVVELWSNMKLDYVGDSLNVTIKWQELTPIAMGAEYNMQFGCKVALFKGSELVDEKDVIISEDVRRDYFGGTVGLLNTIKDGLTFETSKVEDVNEVFVTFKDAPKGVTCHLLYFINVKNTGYRHYAVAVANTADNAAFDLNFGDGEVVGNGSKDDTKHALGLFMPSALKFYYPQEKVSIFDAYGDFGKWLNGTFEENPFKDNRKEDLLYIKQ
ncbi:MAG: hypothetical protein U0L59_07850 [Faecalimonas sp.]|jgi:hypothetical protein|nr:hypothetical protein [Faecalimonas sp.]